MPRIKINEAQESGELEISQYVPRDVYRMRILDVEFKPTKKDDLPMYHFTLEIISPEVVTIQGVDKKVSGIKFDMWAMLEKNTQTITDLHDALDIPAEFDIDEETNLPVEFDYKGMEFDAVVESKEENMLNAQGKPMTGRDGKPMKTYNRNFVRVA